MRSLLVVIALAALSGCGPADNSGSAAPEAGSDAKKLTPVTLQLNWFAEAEHGGYYAALVHGYYRDVGLDVRILPGGPDTPVVQQVARGGADFGIVNADNVLFARAQQAPIVALMAPLQTSPRCILVHESSGIRDFGDLKNMTIAMSASAAFTQFMRHKLKLENVKVVPYSGSVAQFLLDKNFAQQGYVFSEPFVARKGGGDVRVLMVSELGFNPYTSLLFTSEAMIAKHPELVEKMVAASIRGWEQYLREPQQANEEIHRVNPQMELDILAFGAKELAPLVLDGAAHEQGIGTMSPERWQTLADQLVETGQLKRERADVSAAYTTRFLPPAKDADAADATNEEAPALP